MPYIERSDRDKFVAVVEELDKVAITSPGELNYLLTMVAHRYLNQRPESYGMYNDVVGALENCKLELYRRHVSELENLKIKENGDV